MTLTSPSTGLGAFPLTPLKDQKLDEQAFATLISRLAGSGVSSITALGSTGSYMYFESDERARIAELAVQAAGTTPVLVGVGALATSQVLRNVASAETAGAAGLLLAPVSYQRLSEDEVFGLFRDVSEATGLPVVVYDNLRSTHFDFTLGLYERIASLPGIASIKIPGVPADPAQARARVDSIRAVIPESVTIGVSGDRFGAAGLNAGCDAWYSVLAGALPEATQRISRPALAGDAATATAESDRLNPYWDLADRAGGGLRPAAALAHELGLVDQDCLPRPVLGLDEAQRTELRGVATSLGWL